jgi:hypothetical protein
MMTWLRRFFGLECCGPWSKWERKRIEKQVAPRTAAQASMMMNDDSVGYFVTKRWQERHCQKCGRIQQETLVYGEDK